MLRRSLWRVFGVAAPAAVLAFAGWANLSVAQDKKGEEGGKDAAKDIIVVATEAGNFKTLTKLLAAADLVDTLKGKGPFTVFAPTDEAFAKLDKATLDSLMKPENKSKLAGILTYHVVPGKHMAADVMKMKTAKTVNGAELTIAAKDSKLMVDKANVTKTDIAASNGVIFVIDTVLMPAEKSDKKADKAEKKGDGHGDGKGDGKSEKHE